MQLCISLSYLILHKFGNSMRRELRIIPSFRLEKTFKAIESNRKPSTAKATAKPRP